MSGGKSDLCLFPQQLGPVPAPQTPPFPWGSWGNPAKHLEREGPQSGQGQGPAGVGGSCSALARPHPILPSHPLIYPPLETEDLLFSIIYNLRLGPPCSFFPINLSDLRERQTDAP